MFRKHEIDTKPQSLVAGIYRTMLGDLVEVTDVRASDRTAMLIHLRNGTRRRFAQAFLLDILKPEFQYPPANRKGRLVLAAMVAVVVLFAVFTGLNPW
ncbi:MAG TPA: hypothetical protein PLU44_17300 [Candidatus Krumholzibacteria bacterium]|nr:hypothetical protein [Candidatus Krumholzibacteria bacterium]